MKRPTEGPSMSRAKDLLKVYGTLGLVGLALLFIVLPVLILAGGWSAAWIIAAWAAYFVFRVAT